MRGNVLLAAAFALCAAALCVAGCAAPGMPAPAASYPAPAPAVILLDVRTVEIDTSLAGIGPPAIPLVQAGLLHLQQRLRAGGESGTARFSLPEAALHEQPLPESDGIPPAARFEARLVYVAQLDAPGRALPPIQGEARCSMVMVGLPSPAERSWAIQQVTHGVITNMDRALEPALGPWRKTP